MRPEARCQVEMRPPSRSVAMRTLDSITGSVLLSWLGAAGWACTVHLLAPEAVVAAVDSERGMADP